MDDSIAVQIMIYWTHTIVFYKTTFLFFHIHFGLPEHPFFGLKWETSRTLFWKSVTYEWIVTNYIIVINVSWIGNDIYQSIMYIYTHLQVKIWMIFIYEPCFHHKLLGIPHYFSKTWKHNHGPKFQLYEGGMKNASLWGHRHILDIHRILVRYLNDPLPTNRRLHVICHHCFRRKWTLWTLITWYSQTLWKSNLNFLRTKLLVDSW